MLRHDPLICYEPEASSSLTRLLLHIQRDLNPFINKLHDLFKVCFLELTGCQSWSPWKSKIWVRELNPSPSKKIFFWDIDEVNQNFQTVRHVQSQRQTRLREERMKWKERMKGSGFMQWCRQVQPALLRRFTEDTQIYTHLLITL